SLDGRTPHRGWGQEIGRHIKYYSIDEKLAIIGSTNLDKQSMHRSREVSIAVDNAAVTKLWDAKIFNADYSLGRRLLSKDDVEGKDSPPAEIDNSAAQIEATDDSERNDEPIEAQDGPMTQPDEELVQDD